MTAYNTQLIQDGLIFDDDLPTFKAWVNYQHSMIVQMIPGDVLSLIFQFSVNEELYESNSFDFPSDEARHASTFPFTVAAVCSVWRDVAFTQTPYIWQSLHINLSHRFLADAGSKFTMASNWLERAHALPLTIYLHERTSTQLRMIEYRQKVVNFVLGMSHFFPQCERLILDVSGTIQDLFSERRMLLRWPLQSVQALLIGPYEDERSSREPYAKFGLRVAPVRLGVGLGVDIRYERLSWSNLTHAAIRFSEGGLFTHNETLRLIHEARRLEYISLWVSARSPGTRRKTGRPTTYTPPAQRGISNRSVLHVVLKADQESLSRILLAVIQRIAFPSLQKLEHEGISDPRLIIADFLERSSIVIRKHVSTTSLVGEGMQAGYFLTTLAADSAE